MITTSEAIPIVSTLPSTQVRNAKAHPVLTRLPLYSPCNINKSECRKQPGSINLMLSGGIFYSCHLTILSLFESLTGLVETLRGIAKQDIMIYLLSAAVQPPFPSIKQG